MTRHYPIARAGRAARTSRAARAGVLVLLAALSASPARAQEMEPRAYSSSPVGLNFVALAVGNTSGALLFDPSLPIEDAAADLNLGAAGYARTFSLGGRQALAAVGFSYAIGSVEGVVFGDPVHVRKSGLADMRAKISVNLVGPPAMTREQFAAAPRRTILGVSLTVQPPTGQYEEIRLVNLGTNRWAFKPEVGVSVPIGRWFLDAYAGVWFFTNNDEFFPGDSLRRQDPLTSLQAHAGYTFRTHAWVAFDATWYGGGESTIDNGPESIRQHNTRLGGTFSWPLTPRQSIKFSASSGASARAGSDFDTYLVGWQFAWFDRGPAQAPRED